MGGWTEEKPADDASRAAYAAVAGEAAAALGRDAGDRGEVVGYASQVVAGRNYRVRVRFGDGVEALVTVYENLQQERRLTATQLV